MKETLLRANKLSILATSSLSAIPGRVDSSLPKAKMESPIVKAAIGAACTWSYELCMGHSLEFIKVAKQTAPEKSYPSLIRGIVHHKGVLGLLDGFFPWGTIQAIAKGAVFSFAAAGARAAINPLVESDTVTEMVAEVIAGGVGGGFQGLVLSPTLLLKTRVMTDPIFRNDMTFGRTCIESGRVGMRVIRHEGPRALMKGSLVFSAKRVADWSSRYFFSSMVELYLFKGGDPDEQLSNITKLSASLIGGTLSALVTIPIDVMVAQIQQVSACYLLESHVRFSMDNMPPFATISLEQASKAGEKVGVVETFLSEFRRGGMKQIFAFATGSCFGFWPVLLVAHTLMTVYTRFSSRWFCRPRGACCPHNGIDENCHFRSLRQMARVAFGILMVSSKSSSPGSSNTHESNTFILLIHQTFFYNSVDPST